MPPKILPPIPTSLFRHHPKLPGRHRVVETQVIISTLCSRCPIVITLEVPDKHKSSQYDDMRNDEDLQKTVLKASLQLIEKRGLDNLSMREVARKAKVSHQAPYHHFRDRAGIFAALARDGFEILVNETEAAVETAGAKAIDRFLASGSAYVNFALSKPGYFKVMFRRELIPFEKHPDIREGAEKAFGHLMSLIRPLTKKGGDSLKLTLTAWAVAHGIASLALDGALDSPTRAREMKRQEACNAVIKTFAALIK